MGMSLGLPTFALSSTALSSGGGATVPAAPTLGALTAGSGQITIPWTDGADGGASITSHKLYRGTSAGSLSLVGTIMSGSPYTDTGLTNGTTYYYAISAVNAVGEGAQSNVQSATPVATFVQPFNNDAIFYGDSRTNQGGSSSGTLGSGTGVTQTTSATTVDGWINDFTQNRIRVYGNMNYGITGETLEQFVAIPRAVATKGMDYAAASPAAIVVLLGGTNDGSTALGVGGTGRTALQTLINYLTNPAAGAPLYNGQPKTLIIENEWPRGINKTGGSQNAFTGVSTFEAYATWVKTFDYASGDVNANPHVVVVDTFHDSTILDVSSGTNYLNLRGLLYDGLHPMPPMGKAAAQVIANKVNTLLPAVTNLALPTSGTVSSYLNPNPMLSGTSGTVSGMTLASGTIPSNTTVSGPAGLSVAASTEVCPTGATALVLHVTGTIAATSTVRVLQTKTGGTGVTWGTDTLEATAEMAFSAALGSPVQGCSLELYVLTTGNTYNYTIIDQQGQAATGGQTRYFNEYLDASYGYMQRWTQPLKTDAGMQTTGISSINTRLSVPVDAGTIDFTIKIAQWGIGKI
jgi:hypothetical protein